MRVLHADGPVSEYGRNENSRLHLDIGGQGLVRTKPFLWSVSLERDAYGNEMTYGYHEDEANGVRHPLRIVYGSGGDAEIRFRYAAREDGESSPIGTFSRTDTLLLHTIEQFDMLIASRSICGLTNGARIDNTRFRNFGSSRG